MFKTRSYFLRLALITFSLSFFAFADSTPVKVTYRNSVLSVRVEQTLDLRAVLGAICTATNAQCDIEAIPADAQVSPFADEGAWHDVIYRLLNGTGFDFVTVEPGGQTQGVLLIRARAAQGPDRSAANQPPPAISEQAVEAEPPVMEQNAEPEQQAAPAEASASEAVAAAPSLSSEAPSAPEGMNQLPYPDASGQPVYAPIESEHYMPYPDASGNLIPTPQVSEQFLPYPDANGNPIPLPSGAEKYMPYPGPNGELIPLPSASH